MLINLREMKTSGKDEEDFSFRFEAPTDICDIPNVVIVNPVLVDVTVALAGQRSAVVEGEITYTLKGECTSCLKEFERAYTVEIYQEFSQGNEFGYEVKADAIVLDKAVIDEIVLTLPRNFVCGDDCKGFGKTEF
ncbi:MAG: DUF177 domain-containing protein [Clostridia bacterium]|nr:DUF177 domain-containing protein [Clostridia bacterium]